MLGHLSSSAFNSSSSNPPRGNIPCGILRHLTCENELDRLCHHTHTDQSCSQSCDAHVFTSEITRGISFISCIRLSIIYTTIITHYSLHLFNHQFPLPSYDTAAAPAYCASAFRVDVRQMSSKGVSPHTQSSSFPSSSALRLRSASSLAFLRAMAHSLGSSWRYLFFSLCSRM